MSMVKPMQLLPFVLLSLLAYVAGGNNVTSSVDYRRFAEGRGPTSFYDSMGRLKGVLSHQWVPMSQAEATAFYTPYEVCSLLHPLSFGCTKDGSLANTDFSQGGGDECMAHRSGLGSYSSAPTSTQNGAFLRYHSVKKWPLSKGLVDLIKAMRTRGSNTMILVGDSIMAQQYGDALCSLTRYGFALSIFKASNEVSVEGFELLPPSSYVANEDKNQGSTDIFFQIVYLNFSPQDTNDFGRQLTKVQKAIEYITDAAPSRRVTGAIHFTINYGLHFNLDVSERKQYAKLVRELLDHFSENYSRHGHVVVFRETSAQHFSTPSGAFSKEQTNKMNKNKAANSAAYVSLVASRSGIFEENSISGQSEEEALVEEVPSSDLIPNRDFRCLPLASMEMLEIQNWKNAVVRAMVLKDKEKSSNGNPISLISFYHITAGRHDLHTSVHGDCSHFGNVPMLWAPLWQNLFHHYEKGVFSRQ